jgi:hypothetical protein
VRKVLRIAATTAVGLALLSCAPRPRVVYVPPPPVYVPYYRPPLPSSAYYRRQPSPPTYSRRPSVPFGESDYAEAPPQVGSQMVRSTSPSWAAVKKATRTSTAKPAPLAKFKAAQAKAAKVGVENLKKEDIEGLTQAQIAELRGY